jgi:predicted TIM-barrel fold metal-dependent hydrolase
MASPPPSFSRRAFVNGTVALGCACGFGGAGRARQPAPGWRINVHAHHFPPPFVTAIRGRPQDTPQSGVWTVQKALDDMDRAGIAISVNSVTRPAVDFLDRETARRVARECNMWSAQLASDYPGRFGNFATLPMPFTDDALIEIGYALDVLKMQGVCLMTSYGDRWLGHADFSPVLAELDQRAAVAFVHPDSSACCTATALGLPPSLFEFNTDTTRTIASLIFSGAAARCQRIRFIFSHAGGTVPMLLDRFLGQPQPKAESAAAALRRFHYDTAISANAPAMAALRNMVPTSQILFGTDFPYRPSPDQADHLAALFSSAEVSAIERGNALRLMPTLAAPTP